MEKKSADGLALDEVTYNQLRRIAAAKFSADNLGSIQPTMLVHEAWMKIANYDKALFDDRNHFVSLAARAMRQFLIDHVRAKQAKKRGGENQVQVTLTGLAGSGTDQIDVLALDSKLRELATLDARRARVVELKFFGGLTSAEIAKVVDASVATVERDWRFARAWLQSQLEG